jgi:quercetin dioxygenase-like cupin family protein
MHLGIAPFFFGVGPWTKIGPAGARRHCVAVSRQDRGMIWKNAAAQAVFNTQKMGKVTLGAGEFLHAGLNCFSAGQAHRAHTHADQDKLYLVLQGKGTATVGSESSEVEAGDVVLATAGVEHGLSNSGPEPLVVLVVFGPPPRKS